MGVCDMDVCDGSNGHSDCDGRTFYRSRDASNFKQSGEESDANFGMSLEYVNNVMAGQGPNLSRVESDYSSSQFWVDRNSNPSKQEVAEDFEASLEYVNNAMANQDAIASRVQSENSSRSWIENCTNQSRQETMNNQNSIVPRVESEYVSQSWLGSYQNQSRQEVMRVQSEYSPRSWPENCQNQSRQDGRIVPRVETEYLSRNQSWIDNYSNQSRQEVMCNQSPVVPSVESEYSHRSWIDNYSNQSRPEYQSPIVPRVESDYLSRSGNFPNQSRHEAMVNQSPIVPCVESEYLPRSENFPNQYRLDVMVNLNDQNPIVPRVKSEYLPRSENFPSEPRQEVMDTGSIVSRVQSEYQPRSWVESEPNQSPQELSADFEESLEYVNNAMSKQDANSSRVESDLASQPWIENVCEMSDVISAEGNHMEPQIEIHQGVNEWSPFAVEPEDGFGSNSGSIDHRTGERQTEQQWFGNSWSNEPCMEQTSVAFETQNAQTNPTSDWRSNEPVDPSCYQSNFYHVVKQEENSMLDSMPPGYLGSLENSRENLTRQADFQGVLSQKNQAGKEARSYQKLSLKTQLDIIREVEEEGAKRKDVIQKYNLKYSRLQYILRRKDEIKRKFLEESEEVHSEVRLTDNLDPSRELSWNEKLDVIRRIEREGTSTFVIAQEYNLWPYKILEILNEKDNIQLVASQFSDCQSNVRLTAPQNSSRSCKENVPARDDMSCSSDENRLRICEDLPRARNHSEERFFCVNKSKETYIYLKNLSLEEKYAILYEIEEKGKLHSQVAQEYHVWPTSVPRIVEKKDDIKLRVIRKYQFIPNAETVHQWLSILSDKCFAAAEDHQRTQREYDQDESSVTSSVEEKVPLNSKLDDGSRKLTLEEEFDIIREIEEKGRSYSAVAEEYNISVPRVSCIMLRKDVIKLNVAENLNTQQDYNEKVMQWLDRMLEEKEVEAEAPKLKGRPRRKRKKRSVSPAGESSNESEASVASSAAASTSKGSSSSSTCGKGNDKTSKEAATNSADSATGAKRTERKPSAEEKKFVSDVHSFMSSRNTPIGKMPSLGCKQIDLYLFYSKVQDLGGYDKVSLNRLWKSVHDDMGGSTNSTSAATITRKHYEKLLLPYEKSLMGEEEKAKPNQLDQCTKTQLDYCAKTPSSSDAPEDTNEVKRELESPPPAKTPPTPSDGSSRSTPPLLVATSPFSSARSDSSKTSSLRSVRVKSERLKSLSSMIATGGSSPTATPVQQSAVQTPGSPSSAAATVASSPTTLTASSPTPASGSGSVLERQLNSPLVTQQVPTSGSPPVSSAATNASTVVTLTPPPEKDMKEIKLDPKQTNLLAQGKENIPLFEAKSPGLFSAEKPHSPEVIDLETESESGMVKDKLIIPSFKKRKLEILREGGLEVTPVDLDRASVIQQPASATPTTASTMTSLSIPSPSLSTTTAATSTTVPSSPTPASSGPAIVTATITPPVKLEGSPSPPTFPTTVIPKLINVTVTPDTGSRTSINAKQEQQQSSPNSKVINLGTANNANLLQLYANANMPLPQQSPRGFVPPSNARSPVSKVTLSRSMYGNSEKMVYGNPKDILAVPKFMPSPLPRPLSPRSQSIAPGPPTGLCGTNVESPTPGGVLDLTAKPSNDRPSSGRPSLEIVKVPQVPRPSPISLEMHQAASKSQMDQIAPRNDHYPPMGLAMPQPGYPHLLDNRTVTSNNLEISLVNNPAKRPAAIGPPQLSPPNRFNNVIPPVQPALRRIAPAPTHNQQHQQHMNGKYSSRLPSEPISPYTPRKSSTSTNNISSGGGIQHPVIPNVPNLNHLNATNFGKIPVTSYQQQFPMEKRKATSNDVSREQQRRITESDKLAAQQHQRMLEANAIAKQAREAEAASRRQSLPSLPGGFLPGLPPGANQAYLAHQLAAASGNGSAVAVAAAAAAAAGKFLPTMESLYYSPLYNGMFPGPIPPSAAAPQFMTPEMNAFYENLIISQQRLAMQQQQQQPPSSK